MKKLIFALSIAFLAHCPVQSMNNAFFDANIEPMIKGATMNGIVQAFNAFGFKLPIMFFDQARNSLTVKYDGNVITSAQSIILKNYIQNKMFKNVNLAAGFAYIYFLNNETGKITAKI